MSKVPHVPTETKASVVINTQICKKKEEECTVQEIPHFFETFPSIEKRNFLLD